MRLANGVLVRKPIDMHIPTRCGAVAVERNVNHSENVLEIRRVSMYLSVLVHHFCACMHPYTCVSDKLVKQVVQSHIVTWIFFQIVAVLESH